MSKQIELTQGRVAIVDDKDFKWLSQWKWCYAQRTLGTGYAKRRSAQTFRYMHRIITNAPRGVSIDHINHNGLDNRRCNLRFCTISQNNCNARKTKGRSKYKGVSWKTDRGKWAATILNGRGSFLGYFDDEQEAAYVYNQAALQHFGDFARLNIIDPNREGFAETISVLAIEPGLLHTFLPQDSGSLRL